ncbi:MAG: DNA methylase [Lachnospiraceae bacterium]|nr:DNA methylase [Lachnospiraceae bacterium]
MTKQRTYIAIDLKSFYASVECVERGLDPLTTCLVVADESRTDKTICLAVSPALKAYGIPGRARLFEVKSVIAGLKEKPEYIIALPRMELYMRYSAKIFKLYQEYVAPEDMHVYSVDEVFMDVTDYLKTYKMTGRQLALTMVRRVLKETGITATAGIGTNMYLCKIAMDIEAKHMKADEDGVRIAELDEMSYRKKLWTHRPITDFWRVGPGTAKKLAKHGMYTMGDVARCSLGGEYDLFNPALLYKLFGVNARLLIDHAWGYEPCRISDIKDYRPENCSLSHGQVLSRPYSAEEAGIIVREMADNLVLEMVGKRLVADQIVLTVVYDTENLKRSEVLREYEGDFSTDHYGRTVPKHAHGTINLGSFTSSSELIIKKTAELYDSIVNHLLTVRKIYVVAGHVRGEEAEKTEETYEQLELFTDYEARDKERVDREKEKRLQKAILEIKDKYGKNALLRGMNLQEGATAMDRNRQVGGHRS